MRARCGILVGLAVLAACGSSSGRATAPASGSGSGGGSGGGPSGQATVSGPLPCGPARAHTLARSASARIYTSRGGVYGCAHGHRPRRLGSSRRSLREPRVGPVAVAGDDAAYGATSSGVDTVSATVVVRRLTDGRVLTSQPATSRSVGPEFVQSVDALVVKGDGAVAWIAEAGSIVRAGSRRVEVDRVDGRGRALLDSGSTVDVRSLRLRRSRLSWRHGGATRTSTLH